ncbi:MAG: jacalin-like lectin [Nannocystales bacterium]
MSYLDFPRIHFAGGFTANPSTVNNPPLNYQRGNDVATQPWDMATWWNPYGNAIFNLNPDCTVTGVQTAGSLAPTADTLDGAEVFAGNTSSPPKIADLDPQQQNVSEWWGLNLQIGLSASTGKLGGDFEGVAFRNIWPQADGKTYGSGAGGGVYQSVLTNVKIDPGTSNVLTALSGYDTLSVRIHLRSYNGTDATYNCTAANLATLRTKTQADGGLSNLPDDVWTNLQTLCLYHDLASQKSDPTKCGIIYTTVFVNYLMQRWLGQVAYGSYGDQIRTATYQAPSPTVTTAFSCGRLVGTIGPYSSGEPKFFTAARNMGPPSAGSGAFTPMGPYSNFHVSDDGILSADLVNALATANPTVGPFKDVDNLEFAFVGGDKIAGGDISNSDFNAFMEDRGGIVDVQLNPADQQTAKNTPICVRTTAATPVVRMQEPSSGVWLRADQFVFRMNPGVTATAQQPSGDKAQVNVYVRTFGQVPQEAGLKVNLTTMSPADSFAYTNQTIGTGGTPGLDCAPLGTPTDALTFGASASVVNGLATFDLSATDPGNPRGFIDGQVYFLTYEVDGGAAGLVQNPDDLVSVLVFEQTTAVNPTWEGSIQTILGQYGRLYPIMSRFGLDDYESVRTNAEQIRAVLERPITDPFHMPVTRDLSESRRQLIYTWMDAGMPREVTLGGPGGVAFAGADPQSLAFQCGNVVDRITVNGTAHGGDGGSPVAGQTLQAGEWWSEFALAWDPAYPYITAAKFVTNTGREIVANRNGVPYQVHVTNCRVTGIEGRSGDFVDQLTVSYQPDSNG